MKRISVIELPDRFWNFISTPGTAYFPYRFAFGGRDVPTNKVE